MMRNRPGRGGRAPGGHGGAGLLGQGPGPSSGMDMMMSGGGGEGGLLGNRPNQGRPNQGRMPQQSNQGRMQQRPNQDRMQPRPNQERMQPRPNQERMQPRPNQGRVQQQQPRSLLGSPAVDEHQMSRQGVVDRGQRVEMDYFEEPDQGYPQDDQYGQGGFVDTGMMYDNGQDMGYGGQEQDMGYGGRAPAGRLEGNREPPRNQANKRLSQNQRELLGKGPGQGRAQLSPRSLLDAPFGEKREPLSPQFGVKREPLSPQQRRRGDIQRQREEFYDAPIQSGAFVDEEPYARGSLDQGQGRSQGRPQMNPNRERRSRFEPLQPPPKPSKQRELMEKADLQMKLLEEEKRIEQQNLERMAMMQQQQALILQQQQEQILEQQHKMRLMQQASNMMGATSTGAIPSIFDLGNKGVLGKRPASAMGRNDNKKLRRGPGDRWDRPRTLSGNRDKKSLPANNRRDLQKNRQDNASSLRSRAAVRGGTSNNRRDRNNAARMRRNETRSKEQRERKNSSRSDRASPRGSGGARSVKKDTTDDKSKDKDKKDTPAADSDKGKSEEYDPAEPTGEVIPQTTNESSIDIEMKEDSTTEITGEEKTDKTDKTESDNKDGEISLTVTVNKKGRSVNDSDKPEGNGDSPVKTKKYKCNVCSVECYDEPSFGRHMNGKKHREKMEVVMSSSSQLKSRLQAEEHLRQMEEGKTSTAKVLPKGKALETMCKVCDKKFTGAYKDHKDSAEHKAKEDRSKAGCKICNVTTFNTYHDYQKHLQSDWHKKNRSKRQGDDDDVELSELVTLDTVGFDDDSTNKPEFRKPLPVTPGKVTKSPSLEESIPDTYDPKVAVGKKYVVAVSGYFCKACHKFYANETAAKVTHCQSKAHYEKVQKLADAAKKSKSSDNINAAQSDNGKKNETQSGGEKVNENQSDNEKVNGTPSDSEVTTTEVTLTESGNTSDVAEPSAESEVTSEGTIMDSSQDSDMLSQESTADDVLDTSVDTADDVSENDSMDTDSDVTVKVEVTSPVKSSPSTRGRQQRAKRGGAGRGRGAKK